ncbi:flagellar hook-associated protein FlgL [Paenibacillus psychroresistens]|uniref:Flagellar hook-associated protein FlgL n=1 Tax=Paenibacillus psychroresistens TaxID=1778678 RepID=A0A6B8RDH9_9BACL|nr:flagellar hook-associated protein FlgL [Paenibacillus psychroresistens]QGQ93518.1 flagellar hook-associated protein FlgL [Paenibacillus psychroresistens]
MGTRITQNMMNTQLMRNLNSNMRRMDNSQNQLATGRRINKPSDDPVGIAFALRYRSEIAANDQYESNANAAVSWMDYTDVTMNQAGSVLQRVRELTVEAANGTNSPESLQAIKSEVTQLTEQMVTIGNSEFNGKQIFNGQLTDKRPYTLENAENEETDQSNINFELGAGVKIAISVNGDQVFGKAGDEDNLFKVLKDIQKSMDANDMKALTDGIGRLDKRMDAFLETRADIGAKTNRIEMIQDRLKDIGINLTTLQSKTEDADVAAVITSLKTDENVYNSSLDVGAKLIKPSLIDFLR